MSTKNSTKKTGVASRFVRLRGQRRRFSVSISGELIDQLETLKSRAEKAGAEIDVSGVIEESLRELVQEAAAFLDRLDREHAQETDENVRTTGDDNGAGQGASASSRTASGGDGESAQADTSGGGYGAGFRDDAL
ncbi:hypothetical protein MIN45_PP20 (plasmid) [Methylomarinovum tepidoasis]|uniref:Uncharacterized protein n=1 Tax=Methylomarinovum tepidoasis TaxID=2840183 RepID=A0AAU9CKN7_9GAMM|nr:hypothetical protein [Methylomarinovum sp. IN45]BCX90006.1 hypothetical protein MIN45_PP20 [Methylomarinovum sp. IN45]